MFNEIFKFIIVNSISNGWIADDFDIIQKFLIYSCDDCCKSTCYYHAFFCLCYEQKSDSKEYISQGCHDYIKLCRA